MSDPQMPTAPQPIPPRSATIAPPEPAMPKLLRAAMWVAIGALIAAAILCVVWVLASPDGDVIGRAFCTIALLAGFAGVALGDAHAAAHRPDWVVVASMIAWIAALLAGLTISWSDWSWESWGFWFQKLIHLGVIVAVLQLALVQQRLMWRAVGRFPTAFNRAAGSVTAVFLVALVAMIVVYLTVPYALDYPDIYGRIIVSLAILSAVGTAIIPLVTALFAPKAPRPAPPAPAAAAEPLPWPMHADGVTPLPMLPNGQPDFEAARTGVLSPGSRPFPPQPR
ncbi:hypothetical protein [Microbacterium indicum]|uniref:hypothetical protein n=1 Tax=Microbacterium indicum TaxID=358100 RepID=UPI0004261F72|nr:hypothetical protein [Microbacterium indicum]